MEWSVLFLWQVQESRAECLTLILSRDLSIRGMSFGSCYLYHWQSLSHVHGLCHIDIRPLPFTSFRLYSWIVWLAYDPCHRLQLQAIHQVPPFPTVHWFPWFLIFHLALCRYSTNAVRIEIKDMTTWIQSTKWLSRMTFRSLLQKEDIYSKAMLCVSSCMASRGDPCLLICLSLSTTPPRPPLPPLPPPFCLAPP